MDTHWFYVSHGNRCAGSRIFRREIQLQTPVFNFACWFYSRFRVMRNCVERRVAYRFSNTARGVQRAHHACDNVYYIPSHPEGETSGRRLAMGLSIHVSPSVWTYDQRLDAANLCLGVAVSN
ncbi:hypothetical protein D3C71_1817310 [compost metagenome]